MVGLFDFLIVSFGNYVVVYWCVVMILIVIRFENVISVMKFIR